MSRPRVAIRRSPSSSETMPATHAATYSPTLCPMTAAGSTTPGAPEPGQGVLDGEQGRLGERGLAQVSGLTASSP